jgi:hypothetical protein
MRRILFIAALLLATPAAAQSSWSQTPEVTSQRPEIWRAILSDARYQVQHGVIFGDSQEASPQGLGDVYISALHAEFAARYGTCGMTPLARVGESYGGGSPYADWLLRGDAPSPGFVESTLLEGRFLPPGLRLAQTSALSPGNANFEQRYGWWVGLDPDARFSTPHAGLVPGTQWIDVSQGVYAEVFAMSGPGAGELRLRVVPAPGNVPDLNAPASATLVTSLGLDAPEIQPRSERFGPLTWPEGSRLQVEISGTDPARISHLLSVRFTSVARPTGVVFTDLSQGGYLTASVVQNHDKSGPIIRAIRPDFAVVCLGANDALLSGPNFYRRDLLQLIRFIRQSTRDDLPIMLIADVYRELPLDAQRFAYDRYPGVCHQLALEDPFICAVNSRRLTEARGWGRGTAAPFMTDAVHHSPLGARTKAAVEAGAIFRAFACRADINSDGFLDFFDLDDFVAEFEIGGNAADFNSDGFVDFFDLDDFIAAFESGC